MGQKNAGGGGPRSLTYPTVTTDQTAKTGGGLCRKTCLFSGRVQGVGFRYATHNLAQQFDVRGFVRNLPDGRVELVLEGSEPEMDRLIECVRRRMEGFIQSVDVQSGPGTGEFYAFRIRH